MGRNAYCMRFRPVPSEGESFMASKQKILIVDDDNNIAELISLYLTKECYDTKIVNDGEEAVREFHSFQPNLILLDLMLPGMDGAFTDCEVSISPNCCIIDDSKPHFLTVSKVLKKSADNTMDLLKQELEIKKGEILESLHFSSLEKMISIRFD